MTSPSVPPEDSDLLKSVLPALLSDFQHWFGRTISMLEGQTISFLTDAEQADLLTRVRVAQQQVSVSKALASATDSQAGIEMPVVMAWHKLVHECWGVALRLRKEKSADSSSDRSPGNLPPS
ncbi:MAG: DUF2605 domain-containing protein [Cyanobacteria bacterium P01_F01_bin.3]